MNFFLIEVFADSVVLQMLFRPWLTTLGMMQKFSSKWFGRRDLDPQLSVIF